LTRIPKRRLPFTVSETRRKRKKNTYEKKKGKFSKGARKERAAIRTQLKTERQKDDSGARVILAINDSLAMTSRASESKMLRSQYPIFAKLLRSATRNVTRYLRAVPTPGV